MREGTKPPRCSAQTPRATFEAGESKMLHFCISWGITGTLWATPSPPTQPQGLDAQAQIHIPIKASNICFIPSGFHLFRAPRQLPRDSPKYFPSNVICCLDGQYGKYSRQHLVAQGGKTCWDVSCPGISNSSQPIPPHKTTPEPAFAHRNAPNPQVLTPFGLRASQIHSHTALSPF